MKKKGDSVVLGARLPAPAGDGALVHLQPADRRKSHMLVVGSPGSGKSKFLEHLLRHDISHGNGVCVLDIHGTLYQDVKRWCAANYSLTRGITLLDPSTGEYVKGFNPFRPRADIAVDVQVGSMVQALLRVWGAENSNETPTLDRVLRLLFSAMVVRSIPLHEAFHLINFRESKFREEVISGFDEPVIQGAWRQLQSLTKAGEWRSEVLSTENRLFRLVSSPTIRRFMGITDPGFNLDCREIMDRGQVLLVNLKESPHLSEENAKAFAALLVNDLFKTAIMFRDRDTLGHDPHPFFLYMDEWQNVVTPDIQKILAQARKFGLLLVLANQDLAQIRKAFSPEFVDTLMTCCPIKACFGGLNHEDATRMVKEMLAGQIDLNETKYEIEATKFRPEYDRDNVYGDSTFAGIGDTAMYGQFQQLAGLPAARTGASKSEGKGKSVANIPIYRPVEFKEITSRTTYSLEEQFLRWSARLMEQPQRHCFVKLPGQKTQSLLVPLVEDKFVYDGTVSEYEAELAAKTGACRPEEVERMLAEQGRGRKAAEEGSGPPPNPEDLYH
jgi:hypothetical protein